MLIVSAGLLWLLAIQSADSQNAPAVFEATGFLGSPFQQTQHICITFVQRRPNVYDVGPTLHKCYTDVLCLLGSFTEADDSRCMKKGQAQGGGSAEST